MDGRERLSQHLKSIGLQELVAAGVMLRGNQDQARAARFGLMLRLGAERVQDADNGGISREYAEANGRDDGEGEDDGH